MLDTIYSYYLQSESDVKNAVNLIEEKLEKTNDVPYSEYGKLANYLIAIKYDLEEDSGVSVGYLSRWKNDSKDNSSPTVETLSIMANKLNVSLDILCYVDIESLTPTELKLLEYLNSFIDKTKSGEFVWERITKHQAEWTFPSGLIDGNPYTFMVDVSQDMFTFKLIYKSQFGDNTASLEGNIYKFEKGNKIVYITKIGRTTENLNKGNIQYELYLETNIGLNRVCNVDETTKSEINSILINLYEEASLSARTVKLNEKLQNELDELFSEK